MYDISLPQCDLKIKKEHEVVYVFDIVRRKYVKLTPEEFVRQHIVHYLLDYKNFPLGLMNVEVGLKVNNMQRRADVVCYSSEGNVLLVTECKAPDVKITQAVFEQIAQYNIMLKSHFLLVTNGNTHYACKIDIEKQTYSFIDEIPDYKLM